ncbi:antiporter [Anaplasmataceae bacterium AB001_6]|nr:antiporter [Anaplasmataceae bacterium AB001_6]
MGKDLYNWNPEDKEQWSSYGKSVANRNLWISILSLLLGFCVWMCWGVITVQMLNVGFAFSTSDLFTLTAIAGLSGATLRIPSTFFIRIAGGRNTIFFTTVLLLIPTIGTGIALQDKNTPLWQFQLLALLSGFGGGNFASSMSNISFFFPKKIQGYSLGMNAGLGNLGVTVMQIIIPIVMTMAIFGTEYMILQNSSGTFISKIPAGAKTYIYNAGFIWVAILVPLSCAVWFGMNNIRDKHVSPNIGMPLNTFVKISAMLMIGLVTTCSGLWLILPESANGSGWSAYLSKLIGADLSKLLILATIIIVTVFLLKLIPGEIRTSLKRQYKIFNNKHTWSMTTIYTMTFGSFIGYGAALPLSIQVIFGYKHLMVNGVLTHTTINPNAPSTFMFVWIGTFIGAIARPIGGIIADKVGGAKVSQIVSLVMLGSTLALAHYMQKGYASATPEDYFYPFIGLFLILFTATGIGNGSAFRSIAQIFNKEQAGPAGGWASAIAAYGAFYVPQMLSEHIKGGAPEKALYGFAIFYTLCICINWWFYLRKNAYIYNP